MTDVKTAAQGHWFTILTTLGVEARHLERPNRPCPLCKGSRDSFSFLDTDGHGTYYCRKEHSGDGFDLLMQFHGYDFKQAKAEVLRVLGSVADVPKRERKKPDPSKALNAVYAGSVPVFDGCTVDNYLKARGLSVLPKTLRYHPSLELGRKRYPAMLAVVSDVTGKPVSLHRTYLEGTRKAPVENPKMLMTPKGTVNGCAVRLWPATDTVGLAEGIETACSCFELFGVPTWACISAGGLERVVLPESIKHVVIFSDNDLNYAGLKAAYTAAARLHSAGKRVEVKIPPVPGHDFLNELNLRQRATP